MAKIIFALNAIRSPKNWKCVCGVEINRKTKLSNDLLGKYSCSDESVSKEVLWITTNPPF